MITLTIIGVVAAITIPTLLMKHQEQVLKTKLTKIQSVLSNAIQLAANEDGTANITELMQNTLKQLKPGYYCNNTCSPYSDYIITDDGIVYGIHTYLIQSYNSAKFDVSFGATRSNGSSMLQETMAPTFYFILDKNNTIYPYGAPGTIYALKKNIACSKNSFPEECTYWAMKTGKINKASGEWNDALGDEAQFNSYDASKWD